MAKHPHLRDTSRPDGTQPSEPAPTYAIGYGRPPAHTRFKKGQCGNPRGRPKGQRNRRTIVDEVLNEKVTVRRGNRRRSMTKFEAMIGRVSDDALLGNAKALSNIIALTRSLGLMGEPHEATQAEPLTGDDPTLIADFLRRHGKQAEPTETTEKPETAKAEPPSKETKETKS